MAAIDRHTRTKLETGILTQEQCEAYLEAKRTGRTIMITCDRGQERSQDAARAARARGEEGTEFMPRGIHGQFEEAMSKVRISLMNVREGEERNEDTFSKAVRAYVNKKIQASWMGKYFRIIRKPRTQESDSEADLNDTFIELLSLNHIPHELVTTAQLKEECTTLGQNPNEFFTSG